MRFGPLLGVSDEGSAAGQIREAAYDSPKVRALSTRERTPSAVVVALDAERFGGIGEVAVGPDEYTDVSLGMQHVKNVELELTDPKPVGPIRFSIEANQVRAEFELEIFPVNEASDFRFRLIGDKPIVRAETTIPAEDFFTQNPPRVWFADRQRNRGPAGHSSSHAHRD